MPLFVALCLPGIPGGGQVGIGDFFALIVGWVAVGLEYVADEQMNKFLRMKKAGKVKDKVMQSGLWKYSRFMSTLLHLVLCQGLTLTLNI